MKKNKTLNRRDFLKQSVASFAAFTIVPRHVLGGQGFIPPSDQLTEAIIGIGGMGSVHMNYEGAKLLAICDVDRDHLDLALGHAGDDVKGYADFREVLERSDIDIIHIATPPHWHALISIAAAAAGKDVWCEKPMTRTIDEGRKVVETIRNYGSIFRLNTWFRFRDQFYSFGSTVAPIKKLVESGILGWPLKVTVSRTTGFDWKFQWSGETSLMPLPVPENLDYNMWLGPAPFKSYNPERVHAKFRGYWDYDGGGLGDMGQHYLDPVQYILDKDNTSPVMIDVDAPQQHPDAVGSWNRIEMTYEDGCKIILDGENKDKNAPFIEGPEGKLYKGFESDIPRLWEKLNAFPDPAPQVTDFAGAVKERKKFALNEENGHRSCTLVNLGKIAVRLGRSLKFDPVGQYFIDDEGANRFIHQPMRAPWIL